MILCILFSFSSLVFGGCDTPRGDTHEDPSESTLRDQFPNIWDETYSLEKPEPGPVSYSDFLTDVAEYLMEFFSDDLKGEDGLRGDIGPEGPQGAQGAQGVRGSAGTTFKPRLWKILYDGNFYETLAQKCLMAHPSHSLIGDLESFHVSDCRPYENVTTIANPALIEHSAWSYYDKPLDTRNCSYRLKAYKPDQLGIGLIYLPTSLRDYNGELVYIYFKDVSIYNRAKFFIKIPLNQTNCLSEACDLELNAQITWIGIQVHAQGEPVGLFNWHHFNSFSVESRQALEVSCLEEE